jgi:hypothetical protein
MELSSLRQSPAYSRINQFEGMLPRHELNRKDLLTFAEYMYKEINTAFAKYLESIRRLISGVIIQRELPPSRNSVAPHMQKVLSLLSLQERAIHKWNGNGNRYGNRN